MPYFIFKVQKEGGETRDLEYVGCLDRFKEAKAEVRTMRAGLPAGSDCMVRMVFAGDRAEAEARLRERREAPILREWEK